MPTPAQPQGAPAAPAQAPAPEQDEFAAAFAEAVTDAPESASAAAPKEPEAAAVAEPAPVTEAPATPAAEAPATPAAEAPATPAAEPATESPEAKIARLEAENASLRKPPAAPAPAEPATAPAASSEAEQSPKEPEWYKPTEEEVALVKQYETEWPDIYKAQEARTKHAVYNAVQYVFSELAKVYNPQLARFAELANTIEEELALSALRNEHADYDEIHDDVVAWIATLPAAFKAGAEQVMKSGTPQEVTDLIAEYKKTHPKQPATATPSGPAPVLSAAPKTEISAAAKKAAGRLTAVDSQRTTPIAAPDKNDFDGTWREIIGKA